MVKPYASYTSFLQIVLFQSLVLTAVDPSGAVVNPLRCPLVTLQEALSNLHLPPRGSSQCPFFPCFLAYKLVEYPGGMRCSSLTESEGKKTIMCPLTNLPSKFVCDEKYNVRQGRYTRGVLLPGMLQSHFARVSTHEGAFSSSLNLPRELAPKYLTG